MPEINNEQTDIIFGINPVREVLRANLPIERAFVHNPSGAAGSILSQLRDLGVPIIEVTEDKLRSLCQSGSREPNHQGIAVRIASAPYVEVDELLKRAQERGEEPFLLLLDGGDRPAQLRRDPSKRRGDGRSRRHRTQTAQRGIDRYGVSGQQRCRGTPRCVTGDKPLYDDGRPKAKGTLDHRVGCFGARLL